MKVVTETCWRCDGKGHIITRSNVAPAGWAKNVKYTSCDKCNGKGYSEYVMFDVDEAKEILKHCGMNFEEG